MAEQNIAEILAAFKNELDKKFSEFQKNFIKVADQIETATPKIEKAATKIDTATPKIVKVAEQIENVTDKIETAATKIEKNAPEIKNAAAEIKTATPEIKKAAPIIEKAATKIDTATPKIVKAAEQIDTATPKIVKAAEQIDTATPKIVKVASELKDVAASLSNTLSEVKKEDKKLGSYLKNIETNFPRVIKTFFWICSVFLFLSLIAYSFLAYYGKTIPQIIEVSVYLLPIFFISISVIYLNALRFSLSMKKRIEDRNKWNDFVENRLKEIKTNDSTNISEKLQELIDKLDSIKVEDEASKKLVKPFKEEIKALNTTLNNSGNLVRDLSRDFAEYLQSENQE